MECSSWRDVEVEESSRNRRNVASKKLRLLVATESASQTLCAQRGGWGDVLCVMGHKRCSHGKRKDNCADCNPCPHGKRKGSCANCNPCPHGKVKKRCPACKAARAGQPAPPRKRKREPEIKPEPEIKQEPEIKLEPEIKQEPFTIRGYFGFAD